VITGVGVAVGQTTVVAVGVGSTTVVAVDVGVSAGVGWVVVGVKDGKGDGDAVAVAVAAGSVVAVGQTTVVAVGSTAVVSTAVVSTAVGVDVTSPAQLTPPDCRTKSAISAISTTMITAPTANKMIII
jgi:hypothetical protein